MKPVLFNFTDAELVDFVTKMGQPKFRATQIRDWLNRGAPDFESMKNLPEKLRRELDEMIEQNAMFKQAMFIADQQLKQLRRKAVVVINDDRYKL